MTLLRGDHDFELDTPWSMSERSGLFLLVALIPAVLVLDFVAGRGISLHLFYLVPVALAAWNLGERTGYAIAIVAGMAWAFVAIASMGPRAPAGPVAWDVLSTQALFLFVARLVARHRAFAEGVRALARVDADTGALSRREFDRLLDVEVRRSKRYARPLALVLFEVREIKGEPKGLLPAVVRAVNGQVRECDSVSRVAPRRFVVMLVECKPPESLVVVARLRGSLEANLRIQPQELAVAVANYGGTQPTSAASLMNLAESHLHLARSGTGVAEARIE
jgi:GGDEF domain-containing protein